jgi:hypothetical protein
MGSRCGEFLGVPPGYGLPPYTPGSRPGPFPPPASIFSDSCTYDADIGPIPLELSTPRCYRGDSRRCQISQALHPGCPCGRGA